MDATRAAWGAQLDAGLDSRTRGDVPRGWRVGWTTQLRVCTLRAMVQQVRCATLSTVPRRHIFPLPFEGVPS